MTSFRLRILAQVLPFLLVAPGLAPAQTPPTRGEATAALTQSNPAAARYSPQQIDQMVAPIALYPDQLLAQVMMAATYPQQIVEAAEWLKDPNNARLKGDALVGALQKLPWEPSVKSLVAFPKIIVMMSDHIEWTEALGVAFATQQREVMTQVQTLRHLAFKTGRLNKLRHLAVREEGPIIVIAPAEPNQVFVPVYNPVVVYGEWPDRDFPPVFIPPPPDFVAETVEPGLEFSSGFAVIGPLWGWSRPDWRADRITIDRAGFSRITRDVRAPVNNVWVHSGPVVLATSEARPRAAAASVPTGTVAPAAAAAVTSLPQRAVAQPTLIQSPTASSQRATARPGEAQTAPGQAATGQPSTTRPGEARPRRTTSEPGAAGAGRAQTTTAQPNTGRAGQARTTTPPAATEGTTTEPGRSTTHEGADTSGTHPRTRTEPSHAATPPVQPAERERGRTEALPSEPGRMPGAANAPSATRSREQGPPSAAARLEERAVTPAPERAAPQQPREAREPNPGTPEHAGARPPSGPEQRGGMPSPGLSAQRPAPASDAVGHGSSAPPPAAAPHAAPSTQGSPGEERPAGRQDEGNSRGR